MLDGWPWTHASSDFAQYVLDSQGIESIDLGQVNSCHAIQGLRQIEVWLVLATLGFARIGRWCAGSSGKSNS